MKITVVGLCATVAFLIGFVFALQESQERTNERLRSLEYDRDVARDKSHSMRPGTCAGLRVDVKDRRGRFAPIYSDPEMTTPMANPIFLDDRCQGKFWAVPNVVVEYGDLR